MDETARFLAIKSRIDTLSDEKIRVEERFKTEKKNLEALLKEITGKGWDPKKLSELKAQKEQELKEGLDKLDKMVSATEMKIKRIEEAHD